MATTKTFAYFVDDNEADQGVTGNGQSLKALIDTIGSNKATVYFTHHGSASTTYTLTTSETVPSNVTLVFQRGAQIDGAGTLTVNSPGNIQALPQQEIFGSSLTVVFAQGGTIYPEWFGVKGDGSSDNTTAFANLTTCIQASASDYSSVEQGLMVIEFAGGHYLLDDSGNNDTMGYSYGTDFSRSNLVVKAHDAVFSPATTTTDNFVMFNFANGVSADTTGFHSNIKWYGGYFSLDPTNATFDGGGSYQPMATAFRIHGNSDVTFSGLYFRNIKICIDGGVRGQLTIDDCRFRNFIAAIRSPDEMGNTHQNVRIKNCMFSNGIDESDNSGYTTGIGSMTDAAGNAVIGNSWDRPVAIALYQRFADIWIEKNEFAMVWGSWIHAYHGGSASGSNGDSGALHFSRNTTEQTTATTNSQLNKCINIEDNPSAAAHAINSFNISHNKLGTGSPTASKPGPQVIYVENLGSGNEGDGIGRIVGNNFGVASSQAIKIDRVESGCQVRIKDNHFGQYNDESAVWGRVFMLGDGGGAGTYFIGHNTYRNDKIDDITEHIQYISEAGSSVVDSHSVWSGGSGVSVTHNEESGGDLAEFCFPTLFTKFETHSLRNLENRTVGSNRLSWQPWINMASVRASSNTELDTIDPTWSGHEIVLWFDDTSDIITVTHDDNIKLKDGVDFVPTLNGNDTLTLIFNGTNWVEKSRSRDKGIRIGGTTKGEPGSGNQTLTAAMLLGGLIDEDPEGAANWTTDTAANIVAAIDGAYIGQTFECILMNDATAASAEVVTIVAGAGVTLHGSTVTLTEGTNETAKLVFRLTNVTAASEAVDCYILTGI